MTERYIYLDCCGDDKNGTAKNAQVICRYLRSIGYSYGYNGEAKKQQRAYSNMPYMTLDTVKGLYSGSKGAATNENWRSAFNIDKKEFKIKGDKMESDNNKIIIEFISMFGQTGYKNVMRNFGPHYSSVNAMPSYRLQKCITMMQKMITEGSMGRDGRRVMTADNERLERVWTTANGRELPLSKMADSHLHNTILYISRAMKNCIHTIGANTDLAEMLIAMEEERVRRGLHLPLISYKSLKYRKGEI